MSEVEQEETQTEEGTPQVEGVSVEPVPVEPSEDEEAAAEEEESHDADQEPQEPEQPQGLSEKELNKALDKLDREATRHRSRVEEILGEDAGMLLDCPMCDRLTPGQIMPTPDVPERFPAVRAFMGDAIPQDFQQDPNTRTCQTCQGLGMVATGSKVEGQAQLVCTDCGGRGWQGQRAPAITGPTVQSIPMPDANGHEISAAPTIDPPEVADLKRKGYTIIAPVGT